MYIRMTDYQYLSLGQQPTRPAPQRQMGPAMARFRRLDERVRCLRQGSRSGCATCARRFAVQCQSPNFHTSKTWVGVLGVSIIGFGFVFRLLAPRSFLFPDLLLIICSSFQIWVNFLFLLGWFFFPGARRRTAKVPLP